MIAAELLERDAAESEHLVIDLEAARRVDAEGVALRLIDRHDLARVWVEGEGQLSLRGGIRVVEAGPEDDERDRDPEEIGFLPREGVLAGHRSIGGEGGRHLDGFLWDQMPVGAPPSVLTQIAAPV